MLEIGLDRPFKETQASHDEGIDLISRLRMDPNLEAWETTIGQCKLYRGFVPANELRDFLGTMVSHTATGIFVTTGQLTSQGKRFLSRSFQSTMANRLHIIDRGVLTVVLNLCLAYPDLVLEPGFGDDPGTVTEAINLQEQARKAILAVRADPWQMSLF